MGEQTFGKHRAAHLRMNRIFRPYDGWDGFPARSFARLDATEPSSLKEVGEAVFAFDAIDASWSEFSAGHDLDLEAPSAISEVSKALWAKLFGPKTQRPIETLFDKMPIYRIEITAKRSSHFWSDLESLEEGQWVEIVLTAAGSHAVDVYGSIVAEAVEAYLVSVASLSGARENALSNLFNIDAWPSSPEIDIQAALRRATPDQLTVYDVGQGGAAGLLDCSNTASIFFDLGAGSYGNSRTRPNPLRFCWRGSPPVVLSHWDTDHWAGELTDPAASGRDWIAPRQSKLGPTHHAFAARILVQGGSLLIWGATAGATLSVTFAGGVVLSLGRCTGPSRNGSGIACLVENSSADASWLLTGDAGYSEIPLVPSFQIIGIIAPHHGADMVRFGSAPTRPGSGYCRLFYSFGPDNKHGRTSVKHPTTAAINDHRAQSWDHGTWTTTGTIATTIAGKDVLATAENSGGPTGPRNLDSAVMGWSLAPTVPLAGLPCSMIHLTVGCTTNIRQA
ncbi:hypothetical protein [Prosthecodimorpha staleyi]|uniref:Uncharacterized protein n=1 Tax=Prosthecodimorpha staleyi TaxID=2840188 RepID=A0A947GDY1_9HYPH|nr:hypothetical protein [Prosthecodimorpha staleyi]MBT9293088.1 hypothetical protein [Prosthecodimorpha staleyi]